MGEVKAAIYSSFQLSKNPPTHLGKLILFSFYPITHQLLHSACTVLILVAADVDGLCACRILTHMLRADHVAYSLVPVSGYSHASALLRALGESNNDIRSVVLINCGAIVNLTNLLPWDRPELTCYVIDSHRPVHLANVYERERVFVLHDEEEDMDEGHMPSDGEGLSGGEESDDDDGGSADDNDDDSRFGAREEDEDEEGRRRRREDEGEYSELESEDELDLGDDRPKDKKTKKVKKQKRSKREMGKEKKKRRESSGESGMEEEEDDEVEEEEREGGNDEEDGSDEDDEDTSSDEDEEEDDEDDEEGSRRSSLQESLGGGSPTKKETGRQRQKRERKASLARRERIEQYYLGAFHGAPSALVLHRICQEVNRDNRDTLWLAIVGLTDLLVHQRVEHAQYRQMVEGLEVEVQASQAQEQTGFEAADGTMVPACEAGRIIADFEYQFMLYRHWSLYESMYHSPYVASKLLVWWSHGKQRLEELLAKMGFSLAQCRENFKYMDSDLKVRLREELDNHHDEFGLDEVFYLSFHRRMHYGAAVSASDVVYSVAALLEAWQGPAGSDTDSAAIGAGGGATGGNAEEEAALADRLFTARFHEAYDALSGRDEGKLKEGIQLAMALQKTLFRVAVSLHDKKAVRNLDHFRWTIVHNNLLSAEDYLLTQPMAISRLAQLMIDVSREERLRQQAVSQTGRVLWKPKPFLIFAERRNTYLVVGVSCPDQRGEVVKHRFASLFRLAADGCKARYRHDGFDSAVLELDKDSATRFTESLFLACDAGRAPRKSRRGRRSN